MKFISRLLQRGISLLEVMLSLSIIAIVLVMATRYFHVASDGQSMNQVREQIGAVITALQNYNPGSDDFTALGSDGTTVLYEAGFLAQSSDLVVTGSGESTMAVLKNPWGSVISITGNVNGAIVATTFPRASFCTEVAANFEGATCSTGTNFSLTIR
ncbi:MAG TPA: prepilin-type N-terminal cleavage/methylation domain-containing protein [Coxiellaceae bacterium]|nr:prepilin-type N-terminal cleavage/methylation domain-containing protein [Coxiellaceae bacterium]